MAIHPANPPQKRKIVIFSDFDGTIFMQDTGHVLVDSYGCGAKYRNGLEAQFKSGERTFRDISEEMWGSLTIPFNDGFAVMEKALEIDPGFYEFHQYCVANGIPFNVISAGLRPVLQRVLSTFLGEKAASIDIVANDAQIAPNGSWQPIWLHDTQSGHDKAKSVHVGRDQAEAECTPNEVPLVVFIGDGVSDLAGAQEADVLFARRGLRLEEHCIEHKIPYIPFDTFSDIKREIETIVHEDQKNTGGVGKPARYNPRANMWRQMSSRDAVPTLMSAATPSQEEKMLLWPETFTEPKSSRQPTIKEDEESVAA